MKVLALIKTSSVNGTARHGQNKVRPGDRAVHDWYRFVLSFPPHLVQDYLDRLDVRPSSTVLDPFCGTGTTLVECKKLGIDSVGIESNPMAYFASAVKIDWSTESSAIANYVDAVVAAARGTLERSETDGWRDLPLFASDGSARPPMRGLSPAQMKLILKDSISPLPLHKALVLLGEIDRHGDSQMQRYGRLALANALVHRIGNLKFGPEVGTGKIKEDAPVLDAWLDNMATIVRDVGRLKDRAGVPSRVIRADSREADSVLESASVDAVITSPPYPNEKDYTRTTRLESVVLGLIRDRRELRTLKKDLIRSNTRGVYKSDTDDREVVENVEIQDIAAAIERRRVELGKISGFERLYPRVAQLYFGGMMRHLASLRPVLRPGARLAYVVGDQASYLRVMIHTGRILAGLAKSLGYEVTGTDLFRTRPSTVTGYQLREEVLLLVWPGK